MMIYCWGKHLMGYAVHNSAYSPQLKPIKKLYTKDFYLEGKSDARILPWRDKEHKLTCLYDDDGVVYLY